MLIQNNFSQPYNALLVFFLLGIFSEQNTINTQKSSTNFQKMSFKEKVYRKLSPKLQDFALTIAGLEINKTRYSKTFFKYLKDFQSSYRFSRKETLDLNNRGFKSY